MNWSELRFGKHKGKTLPQVIFSDPDWFFWAYDDGIFDNKYINLEAIDIYNKSTNIKIPQNGNSKKVAEYVFEHSTGKFAGLEIVPETRLRHNGSSPTRRSINIDMSIPRQRYDKLGMKILIKDLKFILFGNENYKMTKKRAEIFFSNNDNFDI